MDLFLGLIYLYFLNLKDKNVINLHLFQKAFHTDNYFYCECYK